MVSNPLFIIPDFFCIFPMSFAMATLGLKEMGKFLWEGREKSLPSWLSQFSFAKLRGWPLSLKYLLLSKDFESTNLILQYSYTSIIYTYVFLCNQIGVQPSINIFSSSRMIDRK